MDVGEPRPTPVMEDDADVTGTVLQEFYAGATVFVTGGTGFMGKVLVEKLLRACPKISRVYLLVRAKKGRNVQERVEDITSSPCFSELLKRRPELRSKLTAVAGDISQDALGISVADRRVLSEHVNVVFHLAATIRFDEELKVVITQNVRSAREMMLLCQTFTKLKSAVFVSTAFSNCPSSRIEERLYAPPIPSRDAIDLAERTSNDLLNKMTPGLLGEWPNTYSFSKALAEDAVKFYGQGLHVGVFRPSIVMCCMAEPMPGWTDNMFGPMGLSMGMASGVVRVMDMDADVVCHIVPCDTAINCLIATAWDVAENKETGEIPVYNCVIPKENRHSWRDSYNYLLKYSPQLPLTSAMWYMGVFFITNTLMLNVCYALLHYLPALLLDAYLVITSKRAKMVQMIRKIHNLQAVYSYFTTRNWLFEVDNVQNMWDKLHVNDQNMFDFDMKSIDWNIFYKNAWYGLRTYLAKDTAESIPAAKAKLRRLYWLHRATQCVLTIVFLYLSWAAVSLLPLGTWTPV